MPSWGADWPHAGDRPATQHPESERYAFVVDKLRWVGDCRVRGLSKPGKQTEGRRELVRLRRLIAPPYLLECDDIGINLAQRLAMPAAGPASEGRIATRYSTSSPSTDHRPPTTDSMRSFSNLTAHCHI
jgi:hypothetical protein